MSDTTILQTVLTIGLLAESDLAEFCAEKQKIRTMHATVSVNATILKALYFISQSMVRGFTHELFFIIPRCKW